MTERTVIDYLHDILDTIESCERFIEGMDYDQFISDEKTIFAVRHALEIIGEAAKHIPEETKNKYQSVPLRKITGTRDVIIHALLDLKIKKHSINGFNKPISIKYS